MIEGEVRAAKSKPADDANAAATAEAGTQSAAAGPPRVVLPADEEFKPEAELASDEPAPAVEPFRAARSVLWAGALGMVGAVAWALITALTGYQLGLLAVGLGVLAGIGAAKGGRCQQAQIIGAAAAGVCYFFAQALTVFVLLAQTPSAPDGADVADVAGEHGAKQGAYAEKGTDAESGVDAPAANNPGLDPPDLEPAAATDEAEPEIEMGVGEAFSALFLAILQDTFTSMGVLFLAFAVWEGWRIPRPRQ